MSDTVTRSLNDVSTPENGATIPIGPRGLVVFDGECRFCRRWIRHMNEWFRRRPGAVAWQETDLERLGLTADRCRTAVQFVGSDMRTHAGSDAVARILIVAGFPFNVAGRTMLLPGVRAVAGAAYRWVADNRDRFRGDPPT